LCGKPLIAYTIEAALGSYFIGRTVVSTEDEEIAKIAREYGAEVVERPLELAGDNVLIQPVLEQVVNKLAEDGYEPDFIVLLNPTSPLREIEDVTKAIYCFICGGNDSMISVFMTDYVCLWTHNDDGTFSANYDFENKTRRQEMPKHYQENGAIYIFKRGLLLKKHHFLGGNIAMFPMPASRSIDIDSELDFIMAEAVMNERNAYTINKSKV